MEEKKNRQMKHRTNICSRNTSAPVDISTPQTKSRLSRELEENTPPPPVSYENSGETSKDTIRHDMVRDGIPFDESLESFACGCEEWKTPNLNKGTTLHFVEKFHAETFELLKEKIGSDLLQLAMCNFDTAKYDKKERDDRLEGQEWMLSQMFKRAKKVGDFYHLDVYYYQGPRMGRLQVQDSVGLTPICRTLRWSLAKGLYTDVDMENAHPRFLLQFIQKYPEILSPNPPLEEYIHNREAILMRVMSEMNISRDEAKQNLLKVINGGFKIEEIKVLPSNFFVRKFWLRMNETLEEFYTGMCSLPEFSDFKETRKKYNKKGTTINRFFLWMENKCLHAMYERFTSLGYVVGNLQYDGLMLLNTNHSTPLKVSQADISEVEDHVRFKTGFDVVLKVKPFGKTIDLDELKKEPDAPKDALLRVKPPTVDSGLTSEEILNFKPSPSVHTVRKHEVPKYNGDIKDFKRLGLKLKFTRHTAKNPMGKRALMERFEQYRNDDFSCVSLKGLKELLGMNDVYVPREWKRCECLEALEHPWDFINTEDGEAAETRKEEAEDRFIMAWRRAINAVERGDVDPFLRLPHFSSRKFHVSHLPKVTTHRIPDGVFRFNSVMVLIAAPGSGKTYRLFMDFLEKHMAGLAKNIVIVVCRRSLAWDTESKLESFIEEAEAEFQERADELEGLFSKNGIEVQNYLRNPTGEIRPGSSVIISAEGLHKLEGLHFDYCSFDESESLVRQMFSPFHRNKIERNWDQLKRLIASDSYRVFSDAFMGPLTQELINGYLPSGTDISVLHSTYKRYAGRLLSFTKKEKIFEMFQSDIQKGEKPFLVSSTSRAVSDIKGLCSSLVETSSVRDSEVKGGLYVNAKNPIKKGHSISEQALDCSCMAFNSKVGAGVSVDKPDVLSEGEKWFDTRYVILKNRFAPPPVEMAQITERVREFSNLQSYVSLEGISWSDAPRTYGEQMTQIQAKIKNDASFLESMKCMFPPSSFFYKRLEDAYKCTAAIDESDPRVRLFCLVELQKGLAKRNYVSTWASYMIHQGYKFDARGLPVPPGGREINFGRVHKGHSFQYVYDTDPRYCEWSMGTPEFDGHPRFQEFLSYVYHREGVERSSDVLYGPPDASSTHLPGESTFGEVKSKLEDIRIDEKDLENETFLNVSVPTSIEMEDIKQKMKDPDHVVTEEEVARFTKGRLYKYLPAKFVKETPKEWVEDLVLECKKDDALRKWDLVASFLVKDAESLDHLSNILATHTEKGLPGIMAPNRVAMLGAMFQIFGKMGLTRENFLEGWKSSERFCGEFRGWLGDNLERFDSTFGIYQGRSRKGGTTKEALLDEKRGVNAASRKVGAYSRKVGFRFESTQVKEGKLKYNMVRIVPLHNEGSVAMKCFLAMIEEKKEAIQRARDLVGRNLAESRSPSLTAKGSPVLSESGMVCGSLFDAGRAPPKVYWNEVPRGRLTSDVLLTGGTMTLSDFTNRSLSVTARS